MRTAQAGRTPVFAHDPHSRIPIPGLNAVALAVERARNPMRHVCRGAASAPAGSGRPEAAALPLGMARSPPPAGTQTTREDGTEDGIGPWASFERV